MVKRKSRKVAPKKKPMPKLEKEFDCPFCHHTRTISVALNKKLMVGKLNCRVCSSKYVMRLSSTLCEAVDVYGNWLDKCIEANQPRIGDSMGISAEDDNRGGGGGGIS